MWRKGNPFALFVGMQTGAATVENSMEIPQKIKNGTALWPTDSISGNLPKETQISNSKEHEHLYAHCSIYNRQGTEAAQASNSKWVDTTTLGLLHNGILLRHKKEENFTLWDSMDGPGELMLGEISQSEKDKYHTISLMWNLMNKPN